MKFWKPFLRSKGMVFAAAAALCLLAAVLSLAFGAAGMPLGELVGSPIFYYVRLPRTCACLLAGAALAVSGGVIQGVLANRLASPNIIGVNAGAGLAVTVCCALGSFSGWVIAGSAFLGALAAVTLVTVLSRKVGASRSSVILCGAAVNSFLSALSEAVTHLKPEIAFLSTDFRIGGFFAVSHTRLIPAGILILVGIAVVLALCNELDVLTLGEEAAHSLGLPVKKIRNLLLILSALLAGAAVSFAGLLGFVGLLVPHAARALVGNESRNLLPLCAVGGAGFVTVCDVAARLVLAPYELPVGILLSVLGAPFFALLLFRRNRRDAV